MRDVSQLVTKYKTNNTLKLALYCMIHDEFGGYCQRKILRDVVECFPIEIDENDINVKNVHFMI